MNNRTTVARKEKRDAMHIRMMKNRPMKDRLFEFTIEVFHQNEQEYGDDLVENIDFYDSLTIMRRVVCPEKDDQCFIIGGYVLEQHQLDYFEKKLNRKFNIKKYYYQFRRYDFEGIEKSV